MTKTNAKPAAKQPYRQDRPGTVICLTQAKQAKAKAPKAAEPAPNAAAGPQHLNAGLFDPPAWLCDQVAAQLPPWAPATLVNELILYRTIQTEPGSFARSIFAYPDNEQAMLERILSRPGMNIVWQSIETACAQRKIDFDGFVRQLWHQLAAANAAINQATKTPAQAREELSEIAQGLRSVVRKIERNRSARTLSKRGVFELTAKKLARYLPSTDHPIADQISQEAQIHHVLADSPVTQTREAWLVDALGAACSLSLLDVAKHLVQEIEDCAEGYKGEVKDLGNPAPVFIRRVRGLLKETFGKPMASTVAALLNVALDRELGDISEELVRKTR